MVASVNASTSNGVVVTSDLSGQLALQSNGTTIATASSSGLAISTYNPSASLITSGTSQASTSGTSIDFTSIPSWVKRVTVMFNGVSTSGTAFVIVQIGSTSFSTSGYASTSGWINDVSSVSLTAQSNGFVIFGNTAAYVRNGIMTINLVSANLWAESHSIGGSYSGTFYSANGGGVSPTLGGSLDRIRITTTNGTDTFDAGSINILYE
jgi:hypothetical protein